MIMEEIYKNAERIKTEILFDDKFKGLNSIHRLMIAEVSLIYVFPVAGSV